MRIKVTLSILMIFFLISNGMQAQELNCNFQINTSQIQSTDKKVFETLQKALFDFVNSRKWSNLNVAPSERIECGMTINVQERDIQTNAIKATLSVQSRRPVYNSTYSTSSLNFIDRDLTFVYAEFDPLDYSDNSIGTNLTATVAFYCYMILGIHFDSFALNGGRMFYYKAQNVVNQAQNFSDLGWKANEKNLMNRYQIADSYTNGNYQLIHTIMYEYNRLGLDNMFENTEVARKNILVALDRMKEIYKLKTSLPCKQLFMDSKAEEIVSIFSPVGGSEKQKIMSVLTEVDPANIPKYQTILNPKNSTR